MKILASNKFASSSFDILDKIEAGIVLTGSEVKSVKAGHISIKESYAKLIKEELWLVGARVTPYQPGQKQSPDPLRSRKLLLKKEELKKLIGKLQEQGLTLFPLSVYLKDNFVKLELGLGRGLKKHDKRSKIKAKETKRIIQRKLKYLNK
jgi:SsrA-binding protein